MQVIEHSPNGPDAEMEVVLALVIDGEYVEVDWVETFEIENGILYLSRDSIPAEGRIESCTTIRNWDQVAWVESGEKRSKIIA